MKSNNSVLGSVALLILFRQSPEHLFQTDALGQCFFRRIHRDIQLSVSILCIFRGQAHGRLCRLNGKGDVLHRFIQFFCQL